jgi:hypothetical protein
LLDLRGWLDAAGCDPDWLAGAIAALACAAGGASPSARQLQAAVGAVSRCLRCRACHGEAVQVYVRGARRARLARSAARRAWLVANAALLQRERVTVWDSTRQAPHSPTHV